MPSLICVNSKVFTSHTHLVLHQVTLSTLMPLSKREVNERLCIGEVGVDLELVFMPMDAIYILSLKLLVTITISLITNHGICELIPCNRGSDHDCSSLISFLGQVKTIVFYGSIHQSNLYFDLVSSITPLVSRDYHGTA